MTNDELVKKVIDTHNRKYNSNFHILDGVERTKWHSMLSILLELLIREGHLNRNNSCLKS